MSSTRSKLGTQITLQSFVCPKSREEKSPKTVLWVKTFDPNYLKWPIMHSIQSFDLLSFFVAVSTCVWDWFLSGFTVVLDFLLLCFAVCDFRLCRLCHFGGRHYCWLNLVWMWCVCRWCLTSLMVACRLRPMTSWVILHSKSSLLPTKTKKIVKIENSGCS